MQIEKTVIPYLKNEKFSSGLRLITAKPKKVLENRIDFLCNYAKNKKIIHVGCVDHIPLIEKKIADNVWLHERINQVASKQIGIDINEEGLSYIKNKLNYQNVIYENIISDSQVHEEIQADKWDLMIMGEILEHVDNPVEFLQKLKQKYKPFVDELIISVPNAFAWENFHMALKNVEYINTDHRAWFSVYTLAKNLVLAGFEISFHEYVTSYPNDYRKGWKKFFLKRYPQLNSTIIMVAKF